MKKLILLLSLLISFASSGQIVKMQVQGEKGITSTQRDALTVPAGEFWKIYNTTTSQWEYWDGDSWEPLTSAGFSGDYNDLINQPTIPTVDDTAYGISWDGNSDAPTKNALYDKIETLGTSSSTLTIESDITTNTTISGTQKGISTIYPVNNTTDITIDVDKGTYVPGDVVVFMRKGSGNVTIDRGTNVRLQGPRNIDNVFKIKDVGGYAAITFEYLDGSTLVGSVIGNIERGYTGYVTTSSYSNLESSETADVEVAGTGFSDNMIVTLSGNATLNTVTVNSPTSATLNITSSGTDGDLLTITYDNGQVFVDTDCIELNDLAVPSVVLTTTSTSATWSPTTVAKSGATLRWTVTGGASGVYDANDPTIDLSGNVGTATITVTSADDLAGWTTCRFSSLSITSADVSDWTTCTELWFFGNTSLGANLTGTQYITNAATFDLRNNGLTSLTLPTGTTLTNLQLDFSALASITNLAGATGLQILDINNNSVITSINLSSNTALTSFTASTCPSLSSIVGLSNLTNLTTLNIAIAGFDTIDVDANNLLTDLRVQANSLDVSTINYLIIDLDASGVNTGARILNYSSQTPAASPTATQDSANDVLNAYNSLVSKGWTITGTAPM